MRVSLALQRVASEMSASLNHAAGEDIVFVLIVQADKIAQYISNASRDDGTELIESLLERWKAGRANIPAHYNPDLSAPT